jgi:WD40 repeat protein
VFDVSFSLDGQRIVSSADNTVRIWDATTGEQIGAPLTGHDKVVLSAAFSPDGRRIVSGGEDNTIRVWNAATGEQLGAPITGHQLPVVDVAFSPDGQRFASASIDHTLRVWDAQSGKQIGVPLTGHTDTVSSLAFSPDGEQIVSGSWDDTLLLWPTPALADWPALLCSKLTHNMSDEQWKDWVSPAIDYMETCPGLPIPADSASS